MESLSATIGTVVSAIKLSSTIVKAGASWKDILENGTFPQLPGLPELPALPEIPLPF